MLNVAKLLSMLNDKNTVKLLPEDCPWLFNAIPTIEVHLNGWEPEVALKEMWRWGLTIKQVLPALELGGKGTDVFVLSFPIITNQTAFMVVLRNPEFSSQELRVFSFNREAEFAFLGRLFRQSLDTVVDDFVDSTDLLQFIKKSKGNVKGVDHGAS
jgi:hypothetical protein